MLGGGKHKSPSHEGRPRSGADGPAAQVGEHRDRERERATNDVSPSGKGKRREDGVAAASAAHVAKAKDSASHRLAAPPCHPQRHLQPHLGSAKVVSSDKATGSARSGPGSGTDPIAVKSLRNKKMYLSLNSLMVTERERVHRQLEILGAVRAELSAWCCSEMACSGSVLKIMPLTCCKPSILARERFIDSWHQEHGVKRELISFSRDLSHRQWQVVQETYDKDCCDIVVTDRGELPPKQETASLQVVGKSKVLTFPLFDIGGAIHTYEMP